MNNFSHDEKAAPGLVQIVDLKWLLAGEGVHLHVERLQHDRAYALRVLDAASASANEALRGVAGQVRELLRLDAA